MVCNKCGASLAEETKFCTSCGNNLNTVQNEQVVTNNTNEQPTTNVNQNLTGENVNNVSQPENNNAVPPMNVTPANNVSQPVNAQEDKVNIGLAILSWFIPLAGLIVFLVKKKTSPKTAKVSGICALISFVLNLIVTFVIIFLVFGSLNYVVKESIDEANNYAQETLDEIEDTYNDAIVEGNVDWQEYEIEISGRTYILPMTYNELSTATGFKIKDTHINMLVPVDHYAAVNLYKDDKLALYTEITNNTDKELKYVDGLITRINQTQYQISYGAEAIVFPGDIKVGDTITKSKIIGLFGTPNDIKEYSTGTHYIYLSDPTWTTTNNYKIVVKDDVITEIQLDHRG